MADWQLTLDLKDLKERYERKELILQDMALLVAKRLKSLSTVKISTFAVTELNRIAQQFQEFATDPETCEDTDIVLNKFNELLDELYNWGDLSLDDKFNGKKVCWIKFA